MNTKEEFAAMRQERGDLATGQQRSAANPQKSVWVEASAGTGKTKVLSDRVLRLLLSGVNPQRILCLTYTKAAAVEMNIRISERLSKWSVLPEDKLEESLFSLLGDEFSDIKLQKKYKQRARTLFAVLLDTPGGIKIQTIHSFCQEVLKRFPLEAGVSPYFDILDDESSAEALAQIQKDLLDEAEHGTDSPLKEALQYLTENLSEYSFPQVMKNITLNRSKITDLLKNYIGNEEYENVLAQKLQISHKDTEDTVIADFMAEINVAELRLNIAALLQGGSTDQSRAEKLENILRGGMKPADYNQYVGIFVTQKGTLRKAADKKSCAADAELPERMAKEGERVLQTEDKIRKARLFQATKAVFTIARELTGRYNEFKKQHARLDYEDLILITRNLLADDAAASWVLFKLDGGIDHVLIDEAQDTSPNQWEIVKSLSAEFFAGAGSSDKKRTVFAVGDRKQSIYSFQGADPDKFDETADYFAQRAASEFEKVNLAVSFRSSAAVLNTVNQLFADSEVSKGVTAPEETVNHIPFRAGEFGHVEIWPLLVAEKKEKTDDYNWQPPVEMSKEISVKTRLARQIAAKIKELVEKENLHYRDIMVLVQTRSSFVDEFIRACKNENVNISGADKLRLSEQIAVQDLISLGRFLLLNNDDLSLAEVLKSPIFGLTDDDLIKLCTGRGNAPLWSKLGDFPEYSQVYNDLKTLSNMLDFVRPYELFNYVLTAMNGRYKFTERMGMEVEDALDEFVNLTIAYEQEHIPGLQGFIDWIGRSEVEVKRETEQKDTDAVRLMTVHGSKGLQAPVVFLPDTVRIKNAKNEQALLWSDDVAYYPLNSACYDENCKNIKDRNNDKAFEEYRRLLYVALTRAEDRLYICGFAGKDGADKRSWYELCRKTLQKNGIADGDIITIDEPEVIAKKTDDKVFTYNEIPAPEPWINEKAQSEDLLVKPYTPSHLDEDKNVDSVSPLKDGGNYYRRGTIIHKLLQFLPQSAVDKTEIINEYLDKNAADLSWTQKEQIKYEVMSLLHSPEFSEIFGSCSRAEVPIIGEVKGKNGAKDRIISAQLDRLVILPQKIMIVDFKTNRPAAKDLSTTPIAYINQLQAYAELVQKIYPDKPVETYILWTNETRLMRVS